MAAWGNHANYFKYSDEMMLRTLPDSYFPFLRYAPSAKGALTSSRGVKRHVKIGQVVMLETNPRTAKLLLDRLDEDQTFTLVHIDRNADSAYRREIESFVQERKSDRIQVLPLDESFGIKSKHVSVVWALLQMYFCLADRVYFDYAINFSGDDFPLKSPATIHKSLERLPGRSWMSLLNAPEHTQWRLKFPYMCHEPAQSEARCSEASAISVARTPPHGLFPHQLKQAHWMILHHSAVSYIRYSDKAKLMLAYMEHSLAPDEQYFVSTLLNSVYLYQIIVNRQLKPAVVDDSKRLLVWHEEEPEPRELSMAMKDDILEHRCLFYANKFLWEDSNNAHSRRLYSLLQSIRDKDDFCEPVVRNYEYPFEAAVDW